MTYILNCIKIGVGWAVGLSAFILALIIIWGVFGLIAKVSDQSAKDKENK